MNEDFFYVLEEDTNGKLRGSVKGKTQREIDDDYECSSAKYEESLEASFAQKLKQDTNILLQARLRINPYYYDEVNQRTLSQGRKDSDILYNLSQKHSYSSLQSKNFKEL